MKFWVSLLVLAALALAGPAAAETGASDVLAKVGDQEITRGMIENIINTIPEENRVPFLTPDGQKKILDEVVSMTLFAQEAKAKGMDKEPAVKTRLDYAQTEWLAREFFRRQLAQAQEISDDELKAYYDAHLNEFKPPEEIKVRQILVGTEAEANKILEQIKGGQDFVELAKKKSIDPSAPQEGGKLELADGRDWLPRGTFEKSFEFALFKIPKGQVDGPLKSQFGWHILKVEDKRQPDTRSFVEVRNGIKQRLQDERAQKLHASLMEQLKKNFAVTYK
jgi:peptidyl-prolyl cis-trans isomerase C